MFFTYDGSARDRRPLPVSLLRVLLATLLAIFWFGALQSLVSPAQILAADYQGTLGQYFYYKPLFVITQGRPTPMAESFIEFLTSAEGREILIKTGHLVAMKKL